MAPRWIKTQTSYPPASPALLWMTTLIWVIWHMVASCLETQQKGLDGKNTYTLFILCRDELSALWKSGRHVCIMFMALWNHSFNYFNFSRWRTDSHNIVSGLDSGPLVLFDHETHATVIISPFRHFMAMSAVYTQGIRSIQQADCTFTNWSVNFHS